MGYFKIKSIKQHIHLNLKAEWFDMILSGEKKEEYRDLSDYWAKRLEKLFPVEYEGQTYYPIVETIIFSNGYAIDRRQFEIELKGIKKGEGKEKWGAEKGKRYYVLELGDILETRGC